MQRKYVEKRYVVKRSPILHHMDWFSIYDKHAEKFIMDSRHSSIPVTYPHQYNAQVACDRLNEQSKAYDEVLFKYLTQENPD